MPLQIPHPSSALHLYRHILREATYLPPLARPWSLQYVKSRFRDYRNVEDAKRYIKVAHRQLRFLRAANAGHVERMLRICLLATGRIGKRRRQLASAHLSRPPPADPAALKNGVDSPTDAMRRLVAAAWGQSVDSKPKTNKNNKEKSNLPTTWGPSWLENWDLEKVRILGESQHSHQESSSDWVQGNKIRRTVDPRRSVVTENCWGKTLKPKQMTHRLQKHWVTVISSLMPPLPQGEWDVLKALTRGEAPESLWKIPARRPVALSTEQKETTAVNTGGEALWDWEKYATVPIRKLERKNSRRMKALSGSSGEQPHGQGHPIGVRVFKARSLRRGIYGQTWQASPLMKISAKGRWNVFWGGAVYKPPPSKPRSSDLQFFQGVDKKGKVSAQETNAK